MSANDNRKTDEGAIRDLVENWARAVRTKNLDGILANHAPDMLMFDVPPPIQSNRSVQKHLGSVLFLISGFWGL